AGPRARGGRRSQRRRGPRARGPRTCGVDRAVRCDGRPGGRTMGDPPPAAPALRPRPTPPGSERAEREDRPRHADISHVFERLFGIVVLDGPPAPRPRTDLPSPSSAVHSGAGAAATCRGRRLVWPHWSPRVGTPGPQEGTSTWLHRSP